MLRKDAQRNRERILDVALAELTRSGDTPLHVIAKKAGVGQGTFYRNFPNREALLLEIYHHEAQRLAEDAVELLETREPEQALREWLERLAQCVMARTGLADVIHPSKPRPTLVIDSMELLLRANEAAGTIRPGLTADDLGLAISGLWQIGVDANWERRATRLLDLVMDGVRARAPVETAGHPRSGR